jgi:ribosomal protein S18 acetylase RimI-like enzyme
MVRLVQMNEAEFLRYLESAIESYAQDHIKAGDCDPEDALALAQADYESLLPQGVATKDHYLFSIHVDDSMIPIGLIWFASREKRGKKSAFIYDFQIRPEFRGKGYGAESLRKMESLVAAMGIPRISLHVMGWNNAARALYEKQGYGVTGMGMTKVLA